jgi:fibronectin-binding autotransporter adhesin
VNLHSDGFAESGSAAALSAAGGHTYTSFSTLGVRGSNAVEVGGISATVHGMLGWRHAYGDVRQASAVAFAGQPAFEVAGLPIARNVAVIEGGLDFALTPRLSVDIAYSGQVGANLVDHGIKANILWKF